VRKSLSVENTYFTDLKSIEECLEQLPKLYENFKQRLTKANATEAISGHVVKIKFYDFSQTTLERANRTLPTVASFSDLVAAAYNRAKKPVRLIGIGVRLSEKSEAKPDTANQLQLF